MKSKLVTFDKVLEEKRFEISGRIREAEEAYKNGKVKKGKFEDLWKDLS